MSNLEKGEGRPFGHVSYTVEGEYPVIPASAISKEGAVKDMMPGDWRFLADNTVQMDKGTRKVFIDTNDVIPEDQNALRKRPAVMYLQGVIGGRAVDGYIADLRRMIPQEASRLDYNERCNETTANRYLPVVALGIVVKDRLSKELRYIGQPVGVDAASQLIQAVDQAREKAKKQVKKKTKKTSQTTMVGLEQSDVTHQPDLF